MIFLCKLLQHNLKKCTRPHFQSIIADLVEMPWLLQKLLKLRVFVSYFSDIWEKSVSETNMKLHAFKYDELEQLFQ